MASFGLWDQNHNFPEPQQNGNKNDKLPHKVVARHEWFNTCKTFRMVPGTQYVLKFTFDFYCYIPRVTLPDALQVSDEHSKDGQGHI